MFGARNLFFIVGAAPLRHSPDSHSPPQVRHFKKHLPQPRNCGITHGSNFDDDTTCYFCLHFDLRKLDRGTANQSYHASTSSCADDNTHGTASHRDSARHSHSGSSTDCPIDGATEYNEPAAEFHDESSGNNDRTTYANYDESSGTGGHKRSSHANTTCARTHESGARKRNHYESEHEFHRGTLRQRGRCKCTDGRKHQR